MYSLNKIQAMSEDELSDIIVLTKKADGDVYLDELDSGQFLVSFGEFPETIHTSFADAEHWFKIIAARQQTRKAH